MYLHISTAHYKHGHRLSKDMFMHVLIRYEVTFSGSNVKESEVIQAMETFYAGIYPSTQYRFSHPVWANKRFQA